MDFSLIFLLKPLVPSVFEATPSHRFDPVLHQADPKLNVVSLVKLHDLSVYVTYLGVEVIAVFQVVWEFLGALRLEAAVLRRKK